MTEELAGSRRSNGARAGRRAQLRLPKRLCVACAIVRRVWPNSARSGKAAPRAT